MYRPMLVSFAVLLGILLLYLGAFWALLSPRPLLGGTTYYPRYRIGGEIGVSFFYPAYEAYWRLEDIYAWYYTKEELRKESAEMREFVQGENQ